MSNVVVAEWVNGVIARLGGAGSVYADVAAGQVAAEAAADAYVTANGGTKVVNWPRVFVKSSVSFGNEVKAINGVPGTGCTLTNTKEKLEAYWHVQS